MYNIAYTIKEVYYRQESECIYYKLDQGGINVGNCTGSNILSIKYLVLVLKIQKA